MATLWTCFSPSDFPSILLGVLYIVILSPLFSVNVPAPGVIFWVSGLLLRIPATRSSIRVRGGYWGLSEYIIFNLQFYYYWTIMSGLSVTFWKRELPLLCTVFLYILVPYENCSMLLVVVSGRMLLIYWHKPLLQYLLQSLSSHLNTTIIFFPIVKD